MAMQNADKTTAAKTPKVKKEPVALVKRLTDQLKRGALGGKLTPAELDTLANLATSLKVFVEA